MRSSSDFLDGLHAKGSVRWFATGGCGVLLLLVGACGSTNDPGGEVTDGSAENGGVPPSGDADAGGGTSPEGLGGIGLAAAGGTTGGTAAGGRLGGIGGDRTSGAGGDSIGGVAGDPIGGSGDIPVGSSGGNASGGDSAGGVAGDPIGGTGGTPFGGSGGTASGGDPTGGIGGSPTGGGGNPIGGSGGNAAGGDPTGGIGGSPSGGSGNPTGGSAGDPGGGGNPGGGSGGDTAGGGGEAGTGGTETGGVGACDPGTTHSGGTEYCEYTSVDLSNGYHHLLWSNGGGSLCTTVFEDEATFACEWDTSGDFLALTGLMYDATLTPDQMGTFSSDFAVTGSGNGLVYIGIHGYMDDPEVEFYIIEDWVNDPDGSAPGVGTNLGTITVDGGTYTVYEDYIYGERIIPLNFSIRTDRRQCGHISISEHFAQWVDMELPLGKLEQVAFLVEGINSSGSYEFTRATITVE